MSSHSEHHPHSKSHGFEGTRHYYPQRRHFLQALFAKQNLLVHCVLAHIQQYLKGCCKHVKVFFADRSLIHSAPMKHSPPSIDSSSDDKFMVAPPFTTIGRSIPSMSWLNKQLESGDDRPGMRGEEQNLKSEQPHGTRDAVSQEALSCTASWEYQLQPAR